MFVVGVPLGGVSYFAVPSMVTWGSPRVDSMIRLLDFLRVCSRFSFIPVGADQIACSIHSEKLG